MARQRLDLPSDFPFSTRFSLRITDINYGGHLGNDTLLSLLHEARVRYLRSLGYTEHDIEGCGVMMVDAQIVFSREGFAGDELEISAGPFDAGRTGCDFYYRAVRISDGREIARARTGMIFFDYARRKPLRAPEAFTQRCGVFAAG